jgi:hypothetical protein
LAEARSGAWPWRGAKAVFRGPSWIGTDRLHRKEGDHYNQIKSGMNQHKPLWSTVVSSSSPVANRTIDWKLSANPAAQFSAQQ